MKKLFLSIAVIAFIACNTSGQNTKDAPANVKAAFAQKFPDAKKIKWGAESEKEWEAEFVKDGKEYSANFDITGKWMETEYEISEKEIPAPVKAAIAKEFAGFKIEESEVSETAEARLFEFVLAKAKEKYEVAINAEGKVITKEVAKEEDEKDEEN